MTDTKPLVDHAVSREETALRERILIGHLQPGDRLEADQLSSEFRVDSATIQEAISQLSTEGFVGIIPGQHMVVLGMPPQDVVDNVALFAALTGQAAELATADDQKGAGGVDSSRESESPQGRYRRFELPVSPDAQSGVPIAIAAVASSIGVSTCPGKLRRTVPGKRPANGSGARSAGESNRRPRRCSRPSDRRTSRFGRRQTAGCSPGRPHVGTSERLSV